MMRFHFLIPLFLLLAVSMRSIADSQVYIWGAEKTLPRTCSGNKYATTDLSPLSNYT